MGQVLLPLRNTEKDGKGGRGTADRTGRISTAAADFGCVYGGWSSAAASGGHAHLALFWFLVISGAARILGF